MDKKILDELIDRINSGEATDEELAAYNHYLNQATDAGENWDEQRFGNEEAFGVKMLDGINSRIGYEPKRLVRLWPRIAAAASVLLFLSIGAYFIFHKQSPQQFAQVQKHDIAPGRNQATLTLANGQKIVLTKGLTGKLAQQGNTAVNVNNGQSITYTNTLAGHTDNAPVPYNTLTTVRGEQSPYPLVLADGTKVWLNAASSITFPAAFAGKDRIVKITGEAYFEVVHNAAHPFKVEVKGQTIEDIGTVFNINAYDDEPAVKTTLLSGSVRINYTTTLRPGQVAIQQGTSIKVENIDTEGAVAWKNGYFLFDNESLESIMRKVSRWYDVDVEYGPGQKFTEGFLGSMTRYANVSQVLNVLETAGNVKFKIEGKKIIVTKK